MYNEILRLYSWCVANKIKVEKIPMFDGWKLDFGDGRDIVQHFGSYGSQNGKVEPYGFGKFHCVPVSLATAEILICTYYKL